MEQSPSWEADSHSASQETHRPLLKSKVHYRVHNSPQLVPILSQMIQSTPSHSVSLRSILILSSNLRLDLLRGLFSSGFLKKKYFKHFSSLPCVLRGLPSHHANNIWRGVQIMKLLPMHFVSFRYGSCATLVLSTSYKTTFKYPVLS